MIKNKIDRGTLFTMAIILSMPIAYYSGKLYVKLTRPDTKLCENFIPKTIPPLEREYNVKLKQVESNDEYVSCSVEINYNNSTKKFNVLPSDKEEYELSSLKSAIVAFKIEQSQKGMLAYIKEKDFDLWVVVSTQGTEKIEEAYNRLKAESK